MDKYVEILEKSHYNKDVIQLVKNTILIAEEWVSTPSSSKIKSEVLKEVNKIHKEGAD